MSSHPIGCTLQYFFVPCKTPADLAERLPRYSVGLYQQVRKILDVNKAERHIRGGLATQRKYKSQSG